jgi:hypothetical protein
MSLPILFLDLATTTGWCEGAPGEKPTSGKIRLAPEGSPIAAKHGGLLAFLGTRLTAFRYRAVVYEAPRDPRHMGNKTTMDTAMMLIGLTGVVEAVCHQTGHHRIMTADVHAVRKHLLGCRPQAGNAKHEVIAKLKTLGFAPSDDNEADAIAGWLHTCSVLDPKQALNTSAMFNKR